MFRKSKYREIPVFFDDLIRFEKIETVKKVISTVVACVIGQNFRESTAEPMLSIGKQVPPISSANAS
jgi:hypothetical protein